MAGAKDYAVDPQETGFGPPNMAAQLFGMISSLPNAYQEGVQQKFARGQMKRTEELQKPILDAQGNPVTDSQELLRRSLARDPTLAEKFIPFLTSQEAQTQFYRNLGSAPGGGGGGPPQMGGGYHGDASVDPNVLRKSAGMPPRLGSEPVPDTVNPDRIGTQRQNLTGQKIYPPGKQPEDYGDTSTNVGNAPPDRQVPGSPEPTQAGASPPVTPNQRVAQSFPQYGAPQADAGVMSPTAIENHRAASRYYYKMATAPNITKEQAERAKTLGDEQKSIADKAQELRDKITAETNPQVQAAKTQQASQAEDIKIGGKTYQGLQYLGQVGQIGNQKLDRIRGSMSDPNFMSGAGHQIAQAWKQWSVTLGGDPKAAQPMEEFNKTAQQLLTDDIKAMGQSGAGPVRVAEVQIMKQATANLGISPATNRYLVEEAYRVHNDNIAISRLAQQYKQQHGYLDPGWDAVRDQFYQSHPLFTKEEIADPRLVAPPMMPAAMAADPGKRSAFLRAQGLKVGDPYKGEDGQIRYLNAKAFGQ